MPVEGNVYAALVTELEKRLQLNSTSQFIAFPEFSLRIELDDLLFEARTIQERTGLDAALAQREALLNQEGFAVLVNQIPAVSNRFLTDGKMLWSVYERVLSSAELLTADSDDTAILRTAQYFQSLRTNFALSERDSQSGDGARFYATGTLPPNDVTDADGWTRILLDRQRIDQLSRESSPATEAWLEQRGLLDSLDGAGVQIKSLSAEVFPLALQRPWFDSELFNNRRWNWKEAPLSDGTNPPHGLLPAYITRLILARKLQIELDIAPAGQAEGSTARLAPGTGSSTLSRLMPQIAATALTRQPVHMLTRTNIQNQVLNLRQFTKLTQRQEPSGQRSIDVRPIGSLAVTFPVPVTFLCRPILEQIAAEQTRVATELARLSAERTALQDELTTLEREVRNLERQVRRYPEDVHTVKIRDHRVVPLRQDVLDVDALRRQFADMKQNLQAKQAGSTQFDQSITEQNHQATGLQELQQYYKTLSHAGDDSDIFVLGCVCAITPKAPNPDLHL